MKFILSIAALLLGTQSSLKVCNKPSPAIEDINQLLSLDPIASLSQLAT
tara:strand:+ start:14668 stop:14814 length:147 start_codon:yes stop_codon:yes gene_type:complete